MTSGVSEEGCEEFIHLACECPALATERLGSVRGLKLYRHTGVMLFHQNGGVDVVDVNRNGKVICLIKRNVMKMVNEDTR